MALGVITHRRHRGGRGQGLRHRADHTSSGTPDRGDRRCEPRPVSVRDERGVVAIEFMLVISMLIVVFLLMLQYAVRAHAQRIAAAAADEGLAAPAATTGPPATGNGRRRTTSRGSVPACQSTSVDATRTDTTATVTVGGEVDQLIPFLAVRRRGPGRGARRALRRRGTTGFTMSSRGPFGRTSRRTRLDVDRAGAADARCWSPASW